MYAAIDVGGTKTLLALFDERGQRGSEIRFATPKTYVEFKQNLAAAFTELGRPRCQAAAIAVPDSAMDRKIGVVQAYGNLEWTNTPVQTDVAALLDCPTALENDAKAGGLSEALNIINDYKKVLYVTIGTGVGYAYIVDGIIDHRVPDASGHSLLVPHAGGQQIWESFASGSAIVRQFGQKASQITDPKAWKTIASNFTAGIKVLLEQFPAEAIVFGGGVSVHFEHFGQLVTAELQKSSEVVVLPAVHPEEAVIYGCYELAKKLAQS